MPPSPSPPEPEFLVDRNLGTRIIPRGLTQAGYTVHTLASVFGESEAQQLTDVAWLEHAGTRKWAVLSADDAIRRNQLERRAVERFAVKMFCVTAANLTGQQQLQRILNRMESITRQSERPGPFIYGIYDNSIKLLWTPERE